jgi:hypothetical protein
VTTEAEITTTLDADSAEAVADQVAAHPGAELVGGQPYMRDVKGRLVPIAVVSPIDLLMDEVVRKIRHYAEDLSAQVGRYKQHTLDDVLGFKALLAQEHNTKVGGEKGNITLTSYDGLTKVSVKIADLTFFGPELQNAKAKVTECLRSWSEGARPELIAVVENAFQVDQEGRVNRSDLLYLLRLTIDDPMWNEAMDLIRQAERPMGTKEYVQVHRRASPAAKWEHVAIDVAAA